MKSQYIAINTKIKAKRAKLLTARDYENLCASGVADFNFTDALEYISPYLQKPARDFVKNFYANGFSANFSALDKSSRKSMKKIFAAHLDLQNILWVYRLKRFHKIDDVKIFSFLAPSTHKISAEEMSRLVHAKDLETFAQLVSQTFYGNVFKNFSHGEQALSREIRSLFKKEYRHENLTVVCGYLFECKLQEKNIRVVNAGLKHGLSPTEILEILH